MNIIKLQDDQTLCFEVTAESLELLFKDAFSMTMDTLYSGKSNSESIERVVRLNSINATTMLIDFLNEILSLANIYQEVYTDFELLDFSQTEIKLNLKGFKVEEFDKEITGLSYHNSRLLSRASGNWATQIAIDLQRHI